MRKLILCLLLFVVSPVYVKADQIDFSCNLGSVQPCTGKVAVSSGDYFSKGIDVEEDHGPFSTTVQSQVGPNQVCASPLTYTVGTTNNGQHQFAVRAYDHLGNFTQITYTWKVAAGSIQNFTIDGNALALHWSTVLEVNAEGKIARQRDYWDTRELKAQSDATSR